MKKNFLNAMFDLNNDGKIDFAEDALFHMTIEEMEREIALEEAAEAEKAALGDGYDISEFYEDDEFEDDLLDEMVSALEDEGLDYFELAYMDEDERDALIIEAGLNPIDFEF